MCVPFGVRAAGDDAARLWDAAGGLPLAALVSDREGGWIVVDPDGRFDTNDLETIRGLHWIMREEPLRGLPVEIFMRDYYEPKLVPRLWNSEATTASHPDACEKEFKKVRPLAELDRTQPFVDEPEVTQEDGHADWMTVRVRV